MTVNETDERSKHARWGLLGPILVAAFAAIGVLVGKGLRAQTSSGRARETTCSPESPRGDGQATVRYRIQVETDAKKTILVAGEGSVVRVAGGGDNPEFRFRVVGRGDDRVAIQVGPEADSRRRESRVLARGDAYTFSFPGSTKPVTLRHLGVGASGEQ